MKTTILNKILVVFLLTLSIWGCRYDHVVPEPEPVYNPVVEANAYALPESIPYAGTTTIYWKSENVTLVTINDVPVSSLSGSKTLDSVVKDTTLNFKFTTYNGQVITKSVSIEVAEPPVIVAPTMYDTISSLYWVFQVNKSLVNNEWLLFYFDEDMRTRKWFFYKDKTYSIFSQEKNEIVGGGKYDIRKDTLVLNEGDENLKFKISLSDTISTMFLYNIDSTSINFYIGYNIK